MRVSQSPMLKLNADSFLFACSEADAARRLTNGNFNSHTRYEPFLFATYQEPKSKNFAAFVADLGKVMEHHTVVIPQFRRKEFVDIETVSFFSQSVVTFFADVENLLRVFTTLSLPEFPGYEKIADSYRSTTVISKIMDNYQNYGATLLEDSPAFDAFAGLEAGESEEFLIEFWNLIARNTGKYLGDYASIFIDYISWKYTKKAKKMDIDWRVRPPVGEDFIKYRKAVDPDFGKRFLRPSKFGGNDRGNDRGNGDQKPPFKKQEAFSNDKPASHVKDRPESIKDRPDSRSFDKPERFPKDRPATSHDRPRDFARGGDLHADKGSFNRQGRDQFTPAGVPNKFRDQNRDRPKFRDNNAFTPDESSEVQVENAINASKEAMEHLKNDPNVSEVALAPTNSFLRRAQHAFIVEQGFQTESRGEGKTRCVFVKRK